MSLTVRIGESCSLLLNLRKRTNYPAIFIRVFICVIGWLNMFLATFKYPKIENILLYPVSRLWQGGSIQILFISGNWVTSPKFVHGLFLCSICLLIVLDVPDYFMAYLLRTMVVAFILKPRVVLDIMIYAKSFFCFPTWMLFHCQPFHS